MEHYVGPKAIILAMCFIITVVISQDFLSGQKQKERGYKKYRVPNMDKNGKKEPCRGEEFSCSNDKVNNYTIGAKKVDIFNSSAYYCCTPVVSCLSRNGNCIPLSGYCNFEKQCDDNSDELDCVIPKCQNESDFRCKSGECISSDKYNNFVYDCIDKSDEDKKECKGFQCNDGQCIPQHLKCDGEIDCAGIYKEDERECGDKPDREYEEELWLEGIGFCKNGHWYRRDFECQYTTTLGYMDTCRDATHLEGCENYTCPVSMHKCPKSYCIPYETRCDDIKDCPHGEDEFDCDRKDQGRVTDLQE